MDVFEGFRNLNQLVKVRADFSSDDEDIPNGVEVLPSVYS
jgi:hypothetical protein